MTSDELKQILDYNPETGIFIWKITIGRAKIGFVAGSIDKGGYIRICKDGKEYYAHRLAWFYIYGKWPNYQIDHINGDKIDNRIENLRDVMEFVNHQNLRKARVDNKAGHLGVGKMDRYQKYFSKISIAGKSIYLGSFETPEEAHQAYLDAKRKFHEGCTI